MKLPFYIRFILFLTIGLTWSCAPQAAIPDTDKNVTTIYVVRHGEKMATDPTDKDPALSLEGEARAKELVKYLNGKKIDALYSTDYKRTRNTLQPLSEKYKLTIQTYDPKDNAALKSQILQNHSGKTIVIAGHSNTILAIVEALGAPKPVSEVADSKYDHIFKVTIKADNAITVEAATYGAATN